MKEEELRQNANCSSCNKLIGHTGLPLFWTVDVKRHGVNVNAIKRQDGLAAMLQSPVLASVIGPNEELTETVLSKKITLCERCALPIMELLETITD